MSASSGRGAGAQNGADRGEKAERGGDDRHAGADAGGGQRQPEGVGARGAAHGVGHAQLLGRGPLKGGDRLAKDELLRLQYMRRAASSSSWWSGWYWRLRSSMGTGWAVAAGL